MIRLASWIVASLLLSLLIAWLISLPGTVTIEVAGLLMQPRVGTAALALLAVTGLLVVLWAIIGRIIAAPRIIARRARQQRKEQGITALSDAVIALQAGDPTRARSLARDARAKLADNPAARLIEANSDLALGDMPSAREHYRALIANRRTALAALSGLYDQARIQGREEAALTFAQKAVAIAPTTPWASGAVLHDLTRRAEWEAALDLIAAEPAPNREDKARKRRKQAVLETARARDAELSNPLLALDRAQTALKFLPDFVPAALIAARVQISRGETRKAMSLLRRVWRATAHPDVAMLYANAQPGASAVDRLKKVRELIETPPPNRGAALVLARAAIDAYEWPAAHNALAAYSASEPTRGVCLLMAEIEEGQNADQGKAREWLNRALRAPADPAWTADGVIAEEWAPISPVTGRLDAFEWKVPLSAVAATRPELPAGTPNNPPTLPAPSTQR